VDAVGSDVNCFVIREFYVSGVIKFSLAGPREEASKKK
jgi:hypothetical protein